MDVRFLRWRPRRVPAPVVDAGLAVALAVAITIAIDVGPEQGRPPNALSYGMGLTIAALSLVRRRWPVAVLLASAATLQAYNQVDNPGLFAAVPLSVALATAWAAGHRGWALGVAVWFGSTPLVYYSLADPEFLPRVLGDLVPDIALLAAVLLLGEALRGRRALDREHRLLLAEQERSERLLLNVLPAPIAARLKQREDVIADGFPDVTVLFADLVDFTRRSERIAPEQVVAILNDLFTIFDQFAEREGLEKIKTVGDAYMVAGGLPEPRPDHAEAVAEMALAIRDAVARHTDPSGQPLQVRIGIDTGPVVAGVIGRDKFIYDLWGDTVNTASRMESHGVPGCIQVTARTYQHLRDAYRFERRGPIAVKGKGEMVTWFLVGRTDDSCPGDVEAGLSAPRATVVGANDPHWLSFAKELLVSSHDTTVSVQRLRGEFDGRVLAPGDPDYDQARTVFYGGVDRHPAVIIRPTDAVEVARVVALARDSGLELAVRSGGHSPAWHSVNDGGIVLDLAAMKALDIDVEGRTAWAQTGLTAGEYTVAAAAHGLATGFGDTASVGIGGITLSGGVGYLVRKHGLTVDDLLAAEVVTADGQVLQVDDQSHPELFWAIRGGGGNFGVAIRFHYRLHPVDQVVGGMLFLPATPEVLAGLIAEFEAAPEALSGIVNVMPAPPMPMVPAELHGQLVVISMLVYAGDLAAGERAVAPFRALAAPLADLVRPMPYPGIYPPEDKAFHPTAVGHTMFVDTIDQRAAATILDYLQGSDAAVRVAQLRVLGGAMARVPADATAFAHRGSKIMVNVAAFYDGPDDRVVRQGWVEAFAAALQQSDQGAYVGFLGDEGQARVRQAYPGATYQRLVAVKARYDPTNLFRRNQNIPPADGA